MTGSAENGFFPDARDYPRADVYYVCSPNNPTGAVATRKQLVDLKQHCRDQGSILVFDAAYAPFIRTPGEPKLSELQVYKAPGDPNGADPSVWQDQGFRNPFLKSKVQGTWRSK
jgi:aspartate/methionine/tyrosine aminotransferase